MFEKQRIKMKISPHGKIEAVVVGGDGSSCSDLMRAALGDRAGVNEERLPEYENDAVEDHDHE